MGKKMKLRFLNKHTSSSSHSSHSSSSSSSSWPWPWPSSHQQNTKTISSKACFNVSKPKRIDEPSPEKFCSSSSFSSSSHVMDNPLEPEVIENVIKGLKPSKRFIFEQRGESNSILENASKREIEEEEQELEQEEHEDEEEVEEEEEEEGFMLLALESKDPYSDFKKSMEKMVETHELHHDWRSLEKLLFWFLKVNVKTSHKYIFTAFVDLLLSLPVELSKNLLEDSPSSPISFNTSCSYSDETSSILPGNSICEIKSSGGCCLSSLFEMDEKITDNLDYVSIY